MQLQLSERQRTAVAAALTIVSAAIIVAGIGVLFWLAATFVKAFSAIFLSLSVAAVAALVFHPYYEWLSDRMPKSVALGVVFVSILVPFVAFGWFFGALAVDQCVDLVRQAPAAWIKIEEFAKTRWPAVQSFFESNPYGMRVREVIEGQQENVLKGLQIAGGKALSGVAGFFKWIAALFSWAVVPVYFAFFLMADPRSFGDIEHLLPFLKEETRQDVVYLVKEFVNIIVAFFRGQLLIAFLQGILFAIGFSLAGLKYGLVLGLLLGMLNAIPYLGSIVGLSIALPLAFFQVGGGSLLLGLVIAVFTIVQMIEGWLLTPKIMGDRTGLHPMAIIVAIFFWGTALEGIMGMILAIPLTAFLVVFWRLAREKYIKELV